MPLGPYGGLVADRADKRRHLLGTQSALGLLALLLGLLTVTLVVRLVFVAGALGAVNSVDQPGRRRDYVLATYASDIDALYN